MGYKPFAEQVKIEDASGYFTGTNVETALEELYLIGTSGVVLPNLVFTSGLQKTTNGVIIYTLSGEFSYSTHIHSGLLDSAKYFFGTGNDASINFDGSDLIINSENVTANDEVHFTNFDKVTFDCGIVQKITNATDTYGILETDSTIICSKTTNFTVTLPTAVVGQKFTINNIGAGIVTVDGASTDTIDGDLTQQLIQWESMDLICYVANKWGVL